MSLMFPRLVYRGPAVHMLVTDPAGFDAALSAGWFASVPEAMAPPPLVGVQTVMPPAPQPPIAPPAPPPEPEIPDDDAPPTRAELEQKARAIGVEFSPNIGDKKLSERIAAKLAEEG